MGVVVDFRVLELLCGRLCHDLISPVGAVNNGIELLDEDDPEFVKEAMALIGQSAKKAGQRLQFYRFAYGTAGTGASGAATVDARECAMALLEGGKVRCEWDASVSRLPLPWQRLACNLVLVAADALPRGGKIAVTAAAGAPPSLEIVAEGDSVNLSDEQRAALAATPSVTADTLSARNVHAFYTNRLAEQIGAVLAVAESVPGRAVLTAASSSI
ncbi:MAG TPA: histidine phosphotransferase family protein [Stellaceae bacterium]|nr:histidine phosphotransferase family protein [Stellaceae bacterium]